MAVDAFATVYRSSLWGVPPIDGGASFYSGAGANPDACLPYLNYVQKELNRPDIKSVVEVGCGDLRLAGKLDLGSVDSYICIDAAPQVVDYAKSHGIDVLHADASTSELQRADMLIIKDVLQHWPKESVSNFLKNQLPKFKEAIITNDYTAGSTNHPDIKFGDYTNSHCILDNSMVIMQNVCGDPLKQTHHIRNEMASNLLF